MEPDEFQQWPIEMSFEEAKHVVEEDQQKRKQEIIDNVYPWWRTLKWPIRFLSAGIIALAVALVAIGFTLKNIYDDRDVETEKSLCYDALTNASSEAQANLRAASAHVSNKGWLTLVDAATGTAVTQEDVTEVSELAILSEEAVEADRQALQNRVDWVTSGRPLPCPVPFNNVETDSEPE